MARGRRLGAAHHLVCGTAFALRIGDDPTKRIDQYLQVLLDGIHTRQT
ncbi:hypothetical protein [Catellatospora vulcania]|nr:hypothetical protein [Catellatospora vulcania]